jgi:hypothetical protein
VTAALAMLVPDMVATPPPGLAPWMKAPGANTSPSWASRCEKLMIWSALVE